MPKMIEQMSKSDTSLESNIIIEQVTKSGAKLIDHWNDKEALKKIQTKKWDYVVYQEHSTWPLYQFDYERSYRVAEKFRTATSSSVGKNILFVTWAKKPKSSWYRGKTSRIFKNSGYMLNEINRRSEKLANKLGAVPIKISNYWNFMNRKYPDLNLYDKDNSNPNLAGSYFNALIFYKVFSKSNNISNLNYIPEGLSEKDAKLLQLIVAG